MNKKMDKLSFHSLELARSLEKSLNLNSGIKLSEDSNPEQVIQYIISVAVSVRDYFSDQPNSDTKYEHTRILHNLEKLVYYLELQAGGNTLSRSEEELLTALASTSLHLLTCRRTRI